MAKATPKTEPKEVVKIEQVKTGIILELDHWEAQALVTLTGKVCGGGPLAKATGRVFNALEDAGYKTDYDGLVDNDLPGIYLRESGLQREPR